MGSIKEHVQIPSRIKKKYLPEILSMYSDGEISAGKASEMLGIPRAEFYQLLEETDTRAPEKLNQSIKEELRGLLNRK